MFSSLGLDCYGLATYVRLDEQCVEFLVPSLDKLIVPVRGRYSGLGVILETSGFSDKEQV